MRVVARHWMGSPGEPLVRSPTALGEKPACGCSNNIPEGASPGKILRRRQCFRWLHVAEYCGDCYHTPAMIPMCDLYLWVQKTEARTLKLLKRFVEMESFTYEKAVVDTFAAVLAAEWESRGATVQILQNRHCGSHVRAEINLSANSAGAKQIMVLGHLDTVYPSGTLAKMPFRIANGYAYGPGTFDMKGGLVMALTAVDALQAMKIPAGKLVFL